MPHRDAIDRPSDSPEKLIERITPWIEREFEQTREAALKSIRTERKLFEICSTPSTGRSLRVGFGTGVQGVTHSPGKSLKARARDFSILKQVISARHDRQREFASCLTAR